MQTLSVKFLKEEIQEVKDIVETLPHIVILSEKNISNTIVEMIFYLVDPSLLVTVGQLMGIKRASEASGRIIKSIKF